MKIIKDMIKFMNSTFCSTHIDISIYYCLERMYTWHTRKGLVIFCHGNNMIKYSLACVLQVFRKEHGLENFRSCRKLQLTERTSNRKPIQLTDIRAHREVTIPKNYYYMINYLLKTYQ